MRLKAITGIVLTVLLVGMLTLAFNTACAQASEIEWTRTYGGDGFDYAWSVVETVDGGYAIAGHGFANLVKTDASGNQLWNKTYGGYARSLVKTSDGGYALAGETYSFAAGNNDFWLVKVAAPLPVGGIWFPVDKFSLLTPYIALASTILVATAATAIYVKHVKLRKEAIRTHFYLSFYIKNH